MKNFVNRLGLHNSEVRKFQGLLPITLKLRYSPVCAYLIVEKGIDWIRACTGIDPFRRMSEPNSVDMVTVTGNESPLQVKLTVYFVFFFVIVYYSWFIKLKLNLSDIIALKFFQVWRRRWRDRWWSVRHKWPAWIFINRCRSQWETARTSDRDWRNLKRKYSSRISAS